VRPVRLCHCPLEDILALQFSFSCFHSRFTFHGNLSPGYFFCSQSQF
jgi:hypothetical protein